MVAWSTIGSALGNWGSKAGNGLKSLFSNAGSSAGSSSGSLSGSSNLVSQAVLSNLINGTIGSNSTSSGGLMNNLASFLPANGTQGWNLNQQTGNTSLANKLLTGVGGAYLGATQRPTVYYITSHLNADGTGNVGLAQVDNQNYINPNAWATTMNAMGQRTDGDDTATENRRKAAQQLSNIGQSLRNKWSNWGVKADNWLNSKRGLNTGDFYQTSSSDNRAIV